MFQFFYSRQNNYRSGDGNVSQPTVRGLKGLEAADPSQSVDARINTLGRVSY
jgi:hypothetical protein